MLMILVFLLLYHLTKDVFLILIARDQGCIYVIYITWTGVFPLLLLGYMGCVFVVGTVWSKNVLHLLILLHEGCIFVVDAVWSRNVSHLLMLLHEGCVFVVDTVWSRNVLHLLILLHEGCVVVILDIVSWYRQFLNELSVVQGPFQDVPISAIFIAIISRCMTLIFCNFLVVRALCSRSNTQLYNTLICRYRLVYVYANAHTRTHTHAHTHTHLMTSVHKSAQP